MGQLGAIEWEKKLVGLFVCGLNKATHSMYKIVCYPDKDKETRHEAKPKKAPDAIYNDPAKGSLTIEHTRVEAFEDMLDYENKTFRDVWEPLKGLPLPEHHIVVEVPFKWLANDSKRHLRRKAGLLVQEWWLRERNKFPIGWASYEIPGLQLQVEVENQHIDKIYPGLVSVRSQDANFGEPLKLLVDRVRKAVEDKLEKLVSTNADRHVLLLEIVQGSCSIYSLAQAVDEVRPEFPNLNKVEVWTTPDASSGIKGTPSFHRLREGNAVCMFLSRPEAVPEMPPSSHVPR